MIKLTDRFWNKVYKSNSCWYWCSTKMHGYGYYWYEGKYKRAHRLLYEAINGELSKEVVLDHICRNRDCVNPAHLRECTTKENLNAEGSLVGKNGCKWKRKITHCPKGHEYDQTNTYISKTNHRSCLTCRRERSKIYNQKRKLINA